MRTAVIYIRQSVITDLQKQCHLLHCRRYQPIKSNLSTSGLNKERKIIKYMKYVLALLSICLLNSCYYDNADELNPGTEPCDTTGVVSFSSDIAPIMLHNCGSQNGACHSGTGSQSNYGLESFSAVSSTINSSGTFLKSIIHDPSISSSKWMPQNSSAKISDCNIQKIQAWLNKGMPNN